MGDIKKCSECEELTYMDNLKRCDGCCDVEFCDCCDSDNLTAITGHYDTAYVCGDCLKELIGNDSECVIENIRDCKDLEQGEILDFIKVAKRW